MFAVSFIKFERLTRHRLGNFSDKTHINPKVMNYEKEEPKTIKVSFIIKEQYLDLFLSQKIRTLHKMKN